MTRKGMHPIKRNIGEALENELGEGKLCLFLRSFVYLYHIRFIKRKTLILFSLRWSKNILTFVYTFIYLSGAIVTILYFL